MNAANQEQWAEFWRKLDAKGEPANHWPRLRDAYSENWRAYHNLVHIGHCLQELRFAKTQALDANALEAAIWFHDVVYDMRAKDNEERSADVAEAVLLNGGLPQKFIQQVRLLILATKHNCVPTDNEQGLMVDIDLSILGQNPTRYAAFEEEIRAEYSWVSAADFAAGRSTILKGFIQRKTIFCTTVFVERYEQQARTNLQWAIERLTR
jgi:predicted metal-dependent HD superfamily phosphohydrolase